MNIKTILCFIGMVLTLFSTYLYVYAKGMAYGRDQYRASYNFYLSLKSAYHFGYADAKEGLPEDWDGKKVSYFCSNCTPPQVCWANHGCE